MSTLVSSRNANIPLIASSSTSGVVTSENVQKFKPYFKSFTSRFVQSIVQSRMGISVSHHCEALTEQSEWFNLFVDEVGEISAQVRRNLREVIPDVNAVNLDILLRTADGHELQLEAWRLSIDMSDVQPEKGDMKSIFYHNLSTALKSVITAARCTPTYRRYVFSQGEDSYVLLYRLYVGENIATLGEDAVSLSLASLASPIGRFLIDLRYRTKMEIEQPPPSPPPPVTTGRTRAFSERLPSELTSFDRFDQRRHSARESFNQPALHTNYSNPAFLASSPDDTIYASSPNYSDVVGVFSTSPISEYGDAQTDIEPAEHQPLRRSSRKSSDGEESMSEREKERKKMQIQKFPFSGLLDRTAATPAISRLTQSTVVTQVDRLKRDKHSSASCVSMTIQEEEEESGCATPKSATKPSMTEEEVMALPPLMQSFLAPQFFDFAAGDDSIPNSEDSYVRVPFFGPSDASTSDDHSSGNGELAATLDMFQYRAEKELSTIFEMENRSPLDFQALIKGYAAERDKFDEFVESVRVDDEDSD